MRQSTFQAGSEESDGVAIRHDENTGAASRTRAISTRPAATNGFATPSANPADDLTSTGIRSGYPGGTSSGFDQPALLGNDTSTYGQGSGMTT